MQFRKFLNNKLWRDKVVDYLAQHGSIIHWKKLDDQEFHNQLKIKLIEESHEVLQAQNQESLREELADVLEVIDSLCEINKLTMQDIKATQEEKRLKKGSFSERKFITIVEHPVGSIGEQYCLQNPDKYPEVHE